MVSASAKERFQALQEIAARAAKEISLSKRRICIASHFDADGICAAAILYRAIRSVGKDFELNFIRQLDMVTADSLSKKDCALWLFSDIGSGQLELLKALYSGKKIIVCDHHPPEAVAWAGLVHVNPFLQGIDGTKHISGAGTAYLIASKLTDKAKSTVELAVVGACGDMQGMPGRMHGINRMFLESAELSGRITVDMGIRVFGRYTRQIHKALANSTEPYLNGITGDEAKAVQLLSSLKIPLKEHGRWRTISDLSDAEETRLATALVIGNALSGRDAHEIVGKNFRMGNGFDLRELASALNACGRLEEPIEGLKLALGAPSRAEELVCEYRKKIAKAILWANENMGGFRKTRFALYIVAGDILPGNIIGTLISIISKSGPAPVVFGLANQDGEIKFSARAEKDAGIDLDSVARSAAKAVGGSGGGHRSAAGGRIPLGKESEFINACEAIFEKDASFV